MTRTLPVTADTAPGVTMTTTQQPIARSIDAERHALRGYGHTLVAAGFEVWHCPAGGRSPGYLKYRDPETLNVGLLQRSEYDGWQHVMPIKPSREHGSSMWLADLDDVDPFTVEAARLTVRSVNSNPLVGTHANHGPRDAFLARGSVALHEIDLKVG